MAGLLTPDDFAPHAGLLSSGDMPQASPEDQSQRHVEEETGIPDVATSKTATRSLVHAASGVPVFLGDVAALGANAIKKYAFNSEPNIPYAHNIEDKLLTGLGLGKQEGQEGLETAATLGLAAGQGVAGALGPRLAAVPGLEKLWTLSGTGGGVNQSIMAAAITKDMGIPTATRLTGSVLMKAKDAAADTIDSFRNESYHFFQSPAELLKSVQDIAQQTGVKVGEIMKVPAMRRLQEEMQDSHVTNDVLGDIASSLRGEIEKAVNSTTGFHATTQALGHTLDMVEGYIKQGLSAADVPLYEQALSRYKQALTLLKPNVANWQSGKLNPEMLINTLKQVDPRGYAAGSGVLNQIAGFAEKAAGGAQEAVNVGGKFFYLHERAVLKALSQVAPRLAQQFTQGFREQAVRAAANQPGFAQALGTALSTEGGGESQP